MQITLWICRMPTIILQIIHKLSVTIRTNQKTSKLLFGIYIEYLKFFELITQDTMTYQRDEIIIMTKLQLRTCPLKK